MLLEKKAGQGQALATVLGSSYLLPAMRGFTRFSHSVTNSAFRLRKFFKNSLKYFPLLTFILN